MDNYLSSEFSNLGLSSNAREWRPPGAQQQQQQQQTRSYGQNQPSQQQPPNASAQSMPNEWPQPDETELNYSVKEFVPGHGWNPQASSVSNTTNNGKITPNKKGSQHPITNLAAFFESPFLIFISQFSLFVYISQKRCSVRRYLRIEFVAGEGSRRSQPDRSGNLDRAFRSFSSAFSKFAFVGLIR